MLDQLFLHLVQYADEIKNSSKPSIECTLFKSLEKVVISHTNEPSLTAEYRTSSPIDFSHPSFIEGRYSSSKFRSEGLNPVDCLRYSSEFHFPHHPPESISSKPALVSFELPHVTNKFDPVDSVAGSSVYESSEETDPFCISSPEHSRVSSDIWAVEGASQFNSFNPFADPLFHLPLRPRGGSSDNAQRSSSRWELHQSRLVGGDDRATEWMIPSATSILAESISIIPDMDPAAMIPPTNVFVANFPSHWGKSDLWDLFEGIPVHVLPEKRSPNEETVYGGTGFVNIARAGDAHALLAMLDKKIWLIDGSALKFRLANSSPPTEPINFQVPKKNRTVRRHQHKVIGTWLQGVQSAGLHADRQMLCYIIDRLRAEQTVGNKQLACCDRHQIVVYQNIPSRRSDGPTLSVVHGSRQRNSHFGCNATETSLGTSAPQRLFLEYLKSHLNRRNHYNSQQIVTSSLKQNPAKSLSPVPLTLQDATSEPLEQGPGVQRLNLRLHASPQSGAYFKAVDIPRGLDTLAHRIPYAPSTTYYPWPSDSPLDARICRQANAPSLSLRWVPASYSAYPQAQFSQFYHGQKNSSVFLPPIS